MSTGLKYRREIDGLRAVAVVPVILFHGGFSVFSGGYVGVDVFFVISGYLITTILINELEQGNFSIVGFYERRARRILPALFVVMLACLPFAYMWMLPSQLKDFSQSLVAVVTFSSNILFWQEDGYFAAAAELKPLLHTWSLAVEEQYYLLFPVFLLFAWRFGRKRALLSVIMIAAVSFLMSEWGWRNEPSANFYLAPTRAWELLAGSICAFLTLGRTLKSNSVLSTIGLAAIVFAIFAFDGNTPFPSIYTLVPVVGTAFIILFGQQGTWVAKLLSMRAFVGIGLISYSAYLWHQPLFAFARLRSFTEPSHYLMAALAVASLLLAWATWRWVEQSFRNRANPALVTRRSVFVWSGSVGAVFIAIGLAGHLGGGFNWRFNSAIQKIIAAEDDKADRTCNFSLKDALPTHPVANCLYSNANNQIDVFLLGDSHSLSLSEELGHSLSIQGINYYNVSYNGCVPFTGLKRFDLGDDHQCSQFNNNAFIYAQNNQIKTIVLTARFPLYIRGERFNNSEGGVEGGRDFVVDLADAKESKLNDSGRRQRVLVAYESNIRKIAKSFNVVLVYPIPEPGWNVPNYLFRNVYFNASETILTTSSAAYRERTQEVNALFDRLVAELPNIYGAPVQEVLCSEESGRCVNADAKGVYYFDDDHLSNTGARLVSPSIVKAIEASLGK